MTDSNTGTNSNGSNGNGATSADLAEQLKPGAKPLDLDLPEMSGGEESEEDDVIGDIGERTMGRMLGEIVWVMTQSPGHKHFALGDLEWMVMPPLLLEQYRIFRDGEKPVGVALWAYLDEEAEKKIESGVGRLMPQEWSKGASLDPERGLKAGEGGSLWLVDLICPFATPENKLIEKCLGDLMQSVFAGKTFKFHHTDAKTGQRKVMELKGV